MSSFLNLLLSNRLRPFLTEFIIAAALLALATVGFFWQILLTPSIWMPAGGGDLAPFLYPNYHFAAQHLRQGVIPLWNPHLYSGAPFAADIQSGLFYPINLLVFLLAPQLTYEWLEYLAIFHFWLAGMSMYLCLRLLIPTADRRVRSLPLGPPTADSARSSDFSLAPPPDSQPPIPNSQFLIPYFTILTLLFLYLRQLSLCFALQGRLNAIVHDTLESGFCIEVIFLFEINIS